MLCDINILVIIIWISLFGIFDTIIKQFNNVYYQVFLYTIIGLVAFIIYSQDLGGNA